MRRDLIVAALQMWARQLLNVAEREDIDAAISSAVREHRDVSYRLDSLQGAVNDLRARSKTDGGNIELVNVPEAMSAAHDRLRAEIRTELDRRDAVTASVLEDFRIRFLKRIGLVVGPAVRRALDARKKRK